jgi:hypothetical protein
VCTPLDATCTLLSGDNTRRRVAELERQAAHLTNAYVDADRANQTPPKCTNAGKMARVYLELSSALAADDDDADFDATIDGGFCCKTNFVTKILPGLLYIWSLSEENKLK